MALYYYNAAIPSRFNWLIKNKKLNFAMLVEVSTTSANLLLFYVFPFHTQRTLTKYCDFEGNMGIEILQQFVAGIGCIEVERKCCADKDVTLSLSLSKAIELTRPHTGESRRKSQRPPPRAPTEREQRHMGLPK
jgi:hypothetical protein